MGSLSGLYISQSFQSLIHLGTNGTASAQLTELQDGLGNGLKISVNTQGHISASDVFASGLDVTGTSNFTGKVNINSHFTASTPAYYNSFDPYYSNAVRVTGSFASQGVYPPTINDVQIGWLVNGIGITNAVVTNIIHNSPTDVTFVVDQCCPAASQYYTFTGKATPPVEITGSLIVTDNLIVSGTFDIEGRVRINDDVQITGSVDISNDLTASNAEFKNKLKVDTIQEHTTNNGVTILSNVNLAQNINVTGSVTASAAFIKTDLIVSGTLFAKEVHTLIESSSIIFSSGSNILGDSTADIQTLNGKVIVSGSEEITGSLFVRNDISSSTLNGIGNVTLYSASVNSRLSNLEFYSASAEQKFVAIQASTSSLNNYTASADNKFVAIGASTSSLNNFTASQETKNNTLASYTASVNNKFDAVGISTASLNSFTGSLVQTFVTTASLQATASFLQNQIDQKVFTSSFNSFTQSNDSKWSTLQSYTQSNDTKWSTLASYTASNDTKWSTLANVTSSLLSKTGSYATTGSNTFTGTNTFNKSVNGAVNALTISSNTASMDCSLGNFFTLTLASSTTTRLNPTNIQAGQTISLKILQPATTGSLTYNSSTIKFPAALQYTASAVSNASDILTFVTYDASTLFAVAVKNMI